MTDGDILTMLAEAAVSGVKEAANRIITKTGRSFDARLAVRAALGAAAIYADLAAEAGLCTITREEFLADAGEVWCHFVRRN